jgi:hypothetical protein
MSATRKQVCEREGEESIEWKEMCRSLILKPESRLYKRRLAQSRLVAKNANQMTIHFDDVQKAVKVMNADSDLFHHIGLLQLSCGARIVEVLHVSEFAAIPDDKHRIQVVGTAKSRVVKTFTRPLLFLDSTRFMELVDVVQTPVAGECSRLTLTTRDQISKHYNTRVNDTLKGIIPGVTSHRCRELYANMSYNLLAPSNVSLTKWICDVLGHNPDFLASALHYQGVDVQGMPDRVVTEPSPSVTAHTQSDPVALSTATHGVASLERHHVLRDGQAQSYMDKRVLEMQRKNVPVTDANLRRLGFGGSTIQTYRQRQRTLKRTRDETVDYVLLKDRDGGLHPVAKKPKLRDGQTLHRVGLKVCELQSLNIEPTNRTLRSLDISARTLKLFRRGGDSTVDSRGTK